MTIKETAGKVLLYFYQLQRTVPLSMRYRQLGFINKKTGSMGLTSDKKWLTSNLLDINPSTTDIYNAFTFLTDKGLIRSKGRATAEATIYVGIHLTDAGVDIVEGIERGSDGKQEFTVTFNINVADNVTVDGLVRENLGMLSD